MAVHDPVLTFDVPGARLQFARGDLDVLAAHLAWCYRLMGLGADPVIAVQDFGSSPLSFLGSAMLMPTLEQGIVERLGGRFICLDASAERVTLTPAMLAQLAVDVLVVRAEVADLLADAIERAGPKPRAAPPRTVVAFADEQALPGRIVPWRYLLHAEAALLLAPECRACGCFHLREGFYRLRDRVVHNLRFASARPYPLSDGWSTAAGDCALEPGDCRISYPLREAAQRAQ